MFVAPVTETEVEKIIKSLKSKAAADFDEIPMTLSETMFRLFHKATGSCV
jgi:hypothetical protein